MNITISLHEVKARLVNSLKHELTERLEHQSQRICIVLRPQRNDVLVPSTLQDLGHAV